MPEKLKRKRKPKDKVIQANQWQPDPRQALFLENYLNPESETFSNGLQSALKAGYTQEYAENLLAKMPNWLSEKVGELQMTNQAEKNLTEFLAMDTINTGVTKKGDTFEFDDARLKKIKADVSMFVLERLKKEKYASKSGLDVRVQINIAQLLDKLENDRSATTGQKLADEPSVPDKK